MEKRAHFGCITRSYLVFESVSHYVAQASLEFVILLLLPSKC
jgi:hypothetical protein